MVLLTKLIARAPLMSSTYHPLARHLQSQASSTPWGALSRAVKLHHKCFFILTANWSHVPGTHFDPLVERVQKQSKMTCSRLQYYCESDIPEPRIRTQTQGQDSNPGLLCPNQSTLSPVSTPLQFILFHLILLYLIILDNSYLI